MSDFCHETVSVDRQVPPPPEPCPADPHGPHTDPTRTPHVRHLGDARVTCQCDVARTHHLPRIPRKGEMVKSWFLHDLFAREVQDMRELLAEVNARALESGKDFVYILIQEGDPVIRAIREAGYRYLTLPYVFVAGGTAVPASGSRLYLDVRDI